MKIKTEFMTYTVKNETELKYHFELRPNLLILK